MDLQIPYDSMRDIFLDIEEENIVVKYSEMIYVNGKPIKSDIRPRPGINFGWRVSFAMGFSTIAEYESILHKVKCIEARIQKELPDTLILMSVSSSDSDKMKDSTSYKFNTHGGIKEDSMECLLKVTTLDIIFPTTSDFILSFMEDRKSTPKPKTKSVSIPSTYTDRENELRRIYVIAKTSDVALACWCTPKQCHGETIKEFLDRFTKGGK